MRLKKIILFLLIFKMALSSVAQSNFSFSDSKMESVNTSFSLVNNMIVISAEVNGKRLSFLLDTGIKTTMLFNLQVVDSVELRNVEVIKLRGLGEGNSINAMKSHGNY